MFTEKQCPQCKKIFVCPEARKWKYRIDKKFFCRWECIQAYRKGKR